MNCQDFSINNIFNLTFIHLCYFLHHCHMEQLSSSVGEACAGGSAHRPPTVGSSCGVIKQSPSKWLYTWLSATFQPGELPALRQSRPDTQSSKLLLGEAPLLGLLVTWPHIWVCLGKQFTRHDNQQPTNKNSL